MEIQDLVREQIIGNIKMGTKGEKGPKKLPHFNVEEDKATSKEMVDIFKQLYKDKTTRLIIMFTSEKPFSLKYKRYVNNKLVCMGNDTKAITIGKDDKGYNTQIEVECNEQCEQRCKGKCKLVGSLKFVLPGIEANGVWKINTTGEQSLSNIASELYKYKKNGKSIVNIPFELTLIEKESIGYGIYYCLELHGEDNKPQLVTDAVPKLIQSGEEKTKKLVEENKQNTEKKEKKETKKAKVDNKEETMAEKEVPKLEEINQEEKTGETKQDDLSKYFMVKKFMPTLINQKQFTKIIFQDMNSQDVEYILHPKANQSIMEYGVGTLIELKEARMEMDRNILCKYEVKQVMNPDGSLRDVNDKEELKKAV